MTKGFYIVSVSNLGTYLLFSTLICNPEIKMFASKGECVELTVRKKQSQNC